MFFSFGTVGLLFIRFWDNPFCISLCCKWCPQSLHRSSLNVCSCFRQVVRSYINAWSSHNRSPASELQTSQNAVFDSNLSLIGSVTTLKRRRRTLYSSFLTFLNEHLLCKLRWSFQKFSFIFSLILITGWPVSLTPGSLIFSYDDISL